MSAVATTVENNAKDAVNQATQTTKFAKGDVTGAVKQDIPGENEADHLTGHAKPEVAPPSFSENQATTNASPDNEVSAAAADTADTDVPATKADDLTGGAGTTTEGTAQDTTDTNPGADSNAEQHEAESAAAVKHTEKEKKPNVFKRFIRSLKGK